MKVDIKTENRLVIIGNGFDIANQLPTKYTDFMASLLCDKFTKALSSSIGYFEDEYFVIQKIITHFDFNPVVNTPLYDYLQFRSKNYYKIDDFNRDLRINEILRNEQPIDGIYFFVKDHFLNKIFDSARDFNWVDIEIEYYKQLVELIFNKPTVTNIDYNNAVFQLHSTFQMLQNELEKYLKNIKYQNYTREIADIFDFPINYDFKHRMRDKFDESQTPKETFILNFNYTPTLSNYKKISNWQNDFKIINIHGEINNPDNPIIFGYGDETISSYKQLEDLNNDEYLRFMKNKDYAKTTNYSELISFIESAPFEVYILGHSCGLSDRVMLKTIFESDYCKSIYIFYYKYLNGGDNFMDVYHNVSRQFSFEKRADLRKKVKAKSISMAFPQNRD